jgi:hypothetical protein
LCDGFTRKEGSGGEEKRGDAIEAFGGEKERKEERI